MFRAEMDKIPKMSWSFCQDADEFLLKRRDLLMAEESRNCLAWAAIDRSKKTANSSNDYRFLISQQAPNSIAHAFIHGTDAHIILGEMSPDHARHLVQFLAQQDVILETIEGPWQVAEEFSAHWNRSTNSSTASRMNQGLYELTKVAMPDSMGGHLG